MCHHLGALPGGLGDAGRRTQVADWLDLLVPFVVLLPALATLLAAAVSRATYVWFAVGSWLYATGHGIHLAANSVANAAPGEPAHLWDEYVGHWVWYAGVAVVAATLTTVLVRLPAPRHPVARVLAWVLAVAVGATWATNATGGHFWVGGLVGAVLALGWGWRHRGDGAVVLLAVGAVAVVVLPVSAALA